MTNDQQPAWARDLQTALGDAGKVFERLGQRMTAQAALGHLLDKKPAAARNALDKLPAEQLGELSVAAHALARMAEEAAQK